MQILGLFLNQSTVFYIGVLAAIPVLYAALTIFRLLNDPLRDIPGPFLARLTRLWLFNRVKERHIEREQIKLHQQYGSVVRIAPDHYSFDDVSVLKTVYNHSSKFMKAEYYWCLGRPEPGHANIFSERDGKVHSQKRKKVSSLYSMSSLMSYEGFVDTCIEKFCAVMSSVSAQQTAISIPDHMQFYAFDVIGAITVGKPFGFLEHGCDFQGIIQLLDHQFNFGSLLAVYAEWYGWLAATSTFLGIKNNRHLIEDYISSNVHQARVKFESDKAAVGIDDDPDTPKDFLAKLLALQVSGKVEDLDIWLTVAANIAAGSDTTSISLSAVLYFLIRNPDCLERLRDELSSKNISSPIRFAEAQQCPYLQAVIKESLRLHPAFGVAMPRVVPEEGFRYEDYFFPAGTVVSVNAWAIHYNPAVFGDDAAVFRPERWLESSTNPPERIVELERYLLTFGAGSRTCLGKNISLLEIQKLIPEFVRRFDFELEDPGREWTTKNAVFVKQEYRCFVRERGSAGHENGK